MSFRMLAVVGGAALVAILGVAGGASASNSESWSDPAGDSADAPDLSGITISNDDLGKVTFTVTYANRLGGLNDQDQVPDLDRLGHERIDGKHVWTRLRGRPRQERPGRQARNVKLEDGSSIIPLSLPIACAATLNGKAIRATAISMACVWKLPRSAKGKRLVVTITVDNHGSKKTFGPWKFRVR